MLIVGNKAKGRILKRVFLEKKSTPNCRKNECFLPSDTQTLKGQLQVCLSIYDLLVCAYQGVRNVRFRKIWRAFFSCNTRFEIRPFALLSTY